MGEISKHYNNSRNKREDMINNYIGLGHIVDGFVVDKHHKDGLEVHSITDTEIIIIHNYNTGKIVTKLIARPQQIKRYYNMYNMEVPEEIESVLDLAKWHMILGFNNY